MSKFLRPLLVGCAWLWFLSASSQTHTAKYISMAPSTGGYYEYLPAGYDPGGTQTYPLILFLHGAGDMGNGSTQLPLLLQVGIPKLIDQGQFPSSFTVNGQTHRFIVISPQFNSYPATPTIVNDIETILTYVKQNYKVDLNRVYITGLSMGGGFTFDYAGASASNASRLAAIVPIASAVAPVQSQANTIAAAGLPVWGTHNIDDPVRPPVNTEQYIDWINQAAAPTVLAKKTIFPAAVPPAQPSHDAWTMTYDPNFTENGLNIYQWMLQFSRNITTLPVQLTAYKAFKSGPAQVTITWTTSSEVNNDHFTVERSTDGTSFTTIAVVRGRNNGGTYTQIDLQPAKGDNYYRLSQTDQNGTTTYYQVLKVQLNGLGGFTMGPNPVTDQLQVRLSGTERGMITASVYTTAGTLIRQWMLNKQGDDFQEKLSLSDLAAGAYILQLKAGSQQESRSFIKN